MAQTLSEAVFAAAVCTGSEFTDMQTIALVDALSDYPVEDVLVALKACRSLPKRLTLGEVLARLPNGHPGPEEAWSIVYQTMDDENRTVVWTDEMRVAFGIARPLHDNPVQARMAFLETYKTEVQAARDQRRRPNWSVSLGYDKHQRDAAVMEAVTKGRLLLSEAARVCPAITDQGVGETAGIKDIVGKVANRLTFPAILPPKPETNSKNSA